MRANLPTPFQGDMTSFAKQIGGLHRVEARAITESFPIHAILSIEHHFVRVGAPTLALGRAKHHVDYG
jgi:hypothetical protein